MQQEFEDELFLPKEQFIPLFGVIKDLFDPDFSNNTIIIKNAVLNGETSEVKMKIRKSKGDKSKTKRQKAIDDEFEWKGGDDNSAELEPLYEILEDNKACGDHANIPPKKTRPNDCKRLLKQQKKLLTEKYEDLVVSLMDRCEKNILVISTLKSENKIYRDKIKSQQQSGLCLADENEQLKRKIENTFEFIEECKRTILLLEEKNRELENKLSDLEVPCKDIEQIYSFCTKCNETEIALNRTEVTNKSLQREIDALKQIVNALNAQLGKYQETIVRTSNFAKTIQNDQLMRLIPHKDLFKKLTMIDKATDVSDFGSENPNGKPELTSESFASLLKAYNDAIAEKDALIDDYEQQFEVQNNKMKSLLHEKSTLEEEVKMKENHFTETKDNLKKLYTEKEHKDFELIKLQERCNSTERKLQEVYEIYETKIATLTRDYEVVHKEYYNMKTALVTAEQRVVHLENTLRDSNNPKTVPADMHESRMQEFKRLVDDLKHQHSLDLSFKNDCIARAEQRIKELENKLSECVDKELNLKRLLVEAIKNCRIWRKAAKTWKAQQRKRSRRVFRSSSSSQVSKSSTPDVFNQVLKIKSELQIVKESAHKELNRVEQMIRHKEREIYVMEQKHDLDMSRMKMLVKHKESVIANLLDKLADEEKGDYCDTVSTPDSRVSGKNKKGKDTDFKTEQVPGGFIQRKTERRT